MKTENPQNRSTEPIRLNKFLAQCRLASRRKAEDLIRAGRVAIDGIPIRSPNQEIPLGSVVTVDGNVVKPEQNRLIVAFHKPRGIVTTTDDPQGRKTVLDWLPEKFRGQGLFPVGRLDKETSGLLLLCNDGDLIHRLLHPSHEVWKHYQVTVRGKVSHAVVERLRSGVFLDGKKTAPAEVHPVKHTDSSETVLEIRIREGRKRQIRRMCREVKLHVIDLKRVAFGPIELGNMPEGECRALSANEVRELEKAGGL
jgi:23S rRNA pseudouridine2605 synthase